MAFRWFRQNKQATKWLYIGVTVFVMVTFTVTGAMLDGLADDTGERLAGRFVTKGGETVEVKSVDLRNFSYRLGRLFGSQSDDDRIWEFLMLDALAEEAGIVVADDVLHEYIRSSLSQARIESAQQYEAFLRSLQMSAPAFEELMRRQVRINVYQQLADDPPRVLSEMVYDRFKTDHEEFRLEYIAFPDDEYRAELAAATVSDDELKAFYEDEMDPVRKKNDFTTPERYGLDAAVLDLAAADLAAMTALLPENQREISETEVESFYDGHLDRYLIEDDGGTDDESGDETDSETEDEVESYRPLDEVRAEIEKEITATRLINVAVGEYNQRRAARMQEDAANDAGDDANDAGDDADDAGDADEESDLLLEIAEEYGLEHVDYGEPVLLAEISTLGRIGGKELESVRFLPEGGVRPRHPTDDVRFGAVVRMREKIEGEPKPLEEMKDELREVWREATARKRAEEAAKGFWDALTEKAREAVADEVAKLEQEAADVAEALIEKDAVEDEEKKQEIVDRELAAIEPRVEALLAPHRGEHFAPVAKDRGLEIEAVDWFRKSYRSTAFYRDDEPSPRKFLKGHFPVFDTEEGGVLGPLRDPASETSLVAKVAGRRFPAPSDMTLSDRASAERRVRQEVDPDYWMRQFGRASAFSFEDLQRELRLERFEDRPAEKDEEPSE